MRCYQAPHPRLLRIGSLPPQQHHKPAPPRGQVLKSEPRSKLVPQAPPTPTSSPKFNLGEGGPLGDSDVSLNPGLSAWENPGRETGGTAVGIPPPQWRAQNPPSGGGRPCRWGGRSAGSSRVPGHRLDLQQTERGAAPKKKQNDLGIKRLNPQA